MFWLVVETFILMALAVAVGILAGATIRGVLAARAQVAPAAGPLLAPDDGPEPVAPPPATLPAEPPPAAPLPAEPAPSAADSIVDPDRAAGADQVGVRPPVLSGPRDGRPDDLKRIRGIGPQNEARLNGLGVYHFDQIAAWSPEEARWVGTYLAFAGRIEREDWVGQARRLAAG